MIFQSFSFAEEVSLQLSSPQPAGKEVQVNWSGPNADKDMIAVVVKDATEGSYINYSYTRNGSPVNLKLPDKDGDFEIRYLDGKTYKTLASIPVKLLPINATINAPKVANAGSKISLQWSGPNNQQDYITVVPKVAAEGTYNNYTYTRNGSPLTLQLPDTSGEYELRYISGQSNRTITSVPFVVNLVKASVSSNAMAQAGSKIQVTWDGPNNPQDYITIVEKGAPEGTYKNYTYTKNGSPLSLQLPDASGEFEIRYVTGQSNKTIARQAIKLSSVSATLELAKNAATGVRIEVHWKGPNYPRDYITIVKKGAAEGSYTNYTYTKKGSPLKLLMPDEAGEYEVRYVTGQSNKTLAYSAISVAAESASISGPEQINAGATVSLVWTGPDNEQDYITVVKQGAKEGAYLNYTYTKKGSPLKLRLPDEPGNYEIRYATGQSNKTLFSYPIKLTENTASIQASESVVAGKPFQVSWQGPNNAQDFITIVKRNAKEGTWQNYTYTKRGSPLNLLAPKEAGDIYELRYSTGQSYRTLARKNIQVVASKEPGFLKVTSDPKSLKANSAVEIILDASGSMLKKQNGQRRIAIAKTALTDLVNNSLPDNIQLALRSFGHIKPDSCEGELILKPQKLNRARAVNLINKITPKNLAKTPIAKSLELVASDLNGFQGSKLVILVTDGEETCSGDAEKVIKQLRSRGIDVKLNIVGFAIDEYGLKETFNRWASLGDGHYFDASDQQQLSQSVKNALSSAYRVVDEQGLIVATGVVNGEAISLLPGRYYFKMDSQSKTIDISATKTSHIKL
jgi:hypothetical protein